MMAVVRLGWQRDGLCREYPSLPWIESPRGGSTTATLDQMRSICARCLVYAECRSYAASFGSVPTSGMLAGMTTAVPRRAPRSP